MSIIRSPNRAFTVVRPIKMHGDETLEVQWYLADGSVYMERYTVPPKHVREARSASRSTTTAPPLSTVVGNLTPPLITE